MLYLSTLETREAQSV